MLIKNKVGLVLVQSVYNSLPLNPYIKLIKDFIFRLRPNLTTCNKMILALNTYVCQFIQRSNISPNKKYPIYPIYPKCLENKYQKYPEYPICPEYPKYPICPEYPECLGDKYPIYPIYPEYPKCLVRDIWDILDIFDSLDSNFSFVEARLAYQGCVPTQRGATLLETEREDY